MLRRPDRSVPQYTHRPSTATQAAKAQTIRDVVRAKTDDFRRQKAELLKPKDEAVKPAATSTGPLAPPPPGVAPAQDPGVVPRP